MAACHTSGSDSWHIRAAATVPGQPNPTDVADAASACAHRTVRHGASACSPGPGNAGQTTTGARGLTPGYAPPEQYGFGSTDPRSDLYSFGATLYHSLTGQIPADAFARMVQGTALAPVRYAAPEVTYKTAQVVETALAIKADDRWRTADEMRSGTILARPSTSNSLAEFPGSSALMSPRRG